MFVGQGEPTAQPRRLAHMDTQTAINTPVEQSLQQIASIQSDRAQSMHTSQMMQTALRDAGIEPTTPTPRQVG